MFWNILNVVHFIDVANYNYIHINKGEILILFGNLQNKTPHALAGAGSLDRIVKLCRQHTQIILVFINQFLPILHDFNPWRDHGSGWNSPGILIVCLGFLLADLLCLTDVLPVQEAVVSYITNATGVLKSLDSWDEKVVSKSQTENNVLGPWDCYLRFFYFCLRGIPGHSQNSVVFRVRHGAAGSLLVASLTNNTSWNIHHNISISRSSSNNSLTLWGLGTGHFTSPRDWALFGNFFFFLINQPLFVMVANSPHYSPYFKSTCPSDHNVIYVFLHHQVHNALNDITMTPWWCYNTGTYMSFHSLNQGWTYMSFQSRKG